MFVGAIATGVLMAGLAGASEVVESIVDTTAPTGAVSLSSGGSAPLTINFAVTGKQEGTATFKAYRDWTLSGGAFTGTNPQTFTVPPRAAGDPALLFSTTGTVSVAAGQGLGVFTLVAGAFDITNSNTTGAKLNAGGPSSYQITVVPPPDSSGPVITKTIGGTIGANGWYTSDVTVGWSVTDPESTVVIDSGCGSQIFTNETASASSSCSAHSTGGSSSDSVTITIDKTGPTATLSANGTAGLNGWFTSNVTVATNGADAISGPVSCTPDQPFTNETAGTVVNGNCTNDAGLTTDAAPLTVKIDKTGPTAGLSVTSGTAGANGWYTSDVVVTTDGSDSISGPATCTVPQTLTSETNGVSVTGSCTNAAGIKTDAAPLTVKIDKTNPVAAIVLDGTLGTNGWYTSTVVATTEGSDTVSDPVTCSAPQNFVANTTNTTASGSCTNHAGLVQNATSAPFKIDTTAPTAALSVTSGTLGANGWYTSNVEVTTSGADDISGVTCTAVQTFNTETASTVVTGSCTNGAGLTTDAAPITIKIDKTQPTAALSVTWGTMGANGWYTTTVKIVTSGADDISGVTCTAVQTFSAETASTVVTGSCTNGAGLTTDATPITIKIDKTGPVDVAFAGSITNGATYYWGFVPSAPTCTASDALSGFESCGVSGYATTVGTHTLTATATDHAGNQTTEQIAYTVAAWTMRGFFQPVDMDTPTTRVINTVKNGSTVPLKFEIFAGPSELTNPAYVQSLVATQINCTSGSVVDDIEATATGGTVLRYDGTAGQFVYNWKTPSTKNVCMDVTVIAADGSAIKAHFFLK
jgi:hypothetical protein